MMGKLAVAGKVGLNVGFGREREASFAMGGRKICVIETHTHTHSSEEECDTLYTQVKTAGLNKRYF